MKNEEKIQKRIEYLEGELTRVKGGSDHFMELAIEKNTLEWVLERRR